MTFKEELEFLRGEAIEPKASPADFPCFETCDEERLCRCPLVSVNMITYNHEAYIAQAIESVMAQQTNFDFDVLIGEDCSSDRTREICFEYQKKYPERIRVIWSNQNVYKTCGNTPRLRLRNRGEYVALCEGDDYWCDPLKLQKQVDILQKNPDVSICFGRIQCYHQKKERLVIDTSLLKKWREGIIPGKKFAVSGFVIPTPTVMIRRKTLDMVSEKYEILSWRLNMGDFQLWKALALEGNVYCSHDVLATYRIHGASEMHVNRSAIMRDAGIAVLYFARKTGVFPCCASVAALSQIMVNRCSIVAHVTDKGRRRDLIKDLQSCVECYCVVLKFIDSVAFVLMYWGWGNMFDRYVHVRNGIANRFFKKIFGLKLDGTIQAAPIQM